MEINRKNIFLGSGRSLCVNGLEERIRGGSHVIYGGALRFFFGSELFGMRVLLG
jgi:hypothetical protein